MKRFNISPKTNSSFKTTETRETYRMVEEVIDILSRVHNGDTLSTSTIVEIGHRLGYCRPLIDNQRVANGHPYWKILSEMSDIKSVHFINNLEEMKENGVLCYRLRDDCYRKSSGNWRKKPGVHLKYKLSQNN